MGKHLTLPSTCKSRVTRNSTFRNDCPPWNGRTFSTGKYPWKNQVHHILCQHSITDFDIKDREQFAYIKACLCLADWDINDASNLIGLPLKSVYIRSDGTLPTNLCCHNVDHNTAGGYTLEVKQWLHDNVWSTLRANRKAHEVEAKNIKRQLEKCTAHFKAVLARRSRRNKGTLVSWNNRFEEAHAKKWYRPFSMAAQPTHRSPGGRGNLRIFQAIG